jgi:hypothetical protein
MRTKFFTLVALMVAGAAQADVVVIENAGSSGSSTAGNHFDIEWTQATTSANLSSFKLFGYTGSAYNVQFELFRYPSSGGFQYVSEIISGTNDFTFTGAISNASLTAGTCLLRITGLYETISDPNDPNYPGNVLKDGYNFNSNPNGTTTGAYGFSNATQTAVTGTSQYLTYQLSAVPEPGTMLLASMAAACGGGGVWWRKRKKAKRQAEPKPRTEV